MWQFSYFLRDHEIVVCTQLCIVVCVLNVFHPNDVLTEVVQWHWLAVSTSLRHAARCLIVTNTCDYIVLHFCTTFDRHAFLQSSLAAWN